MTSIRPAARTAALVASMATMALTTLLTPAHAAFQVNDVAFTCTGDLSLTGVDAFILNCSADLSLQGLSGSAFIEAPDSISVFAAGSLSLAGLRLSSHLIELHAQSAVSLGQDVVVVATPTPTTGSEPAPELRLTAGNVRLGTDRTWANATRPGGTLSIEPGGDIRLVSGGLVDLGGDVQVLDGGRLQVSSVPEPSSLALLLGGLVAVGTAWRRRG